MKFSDHTLVAVGGSKGIISVYDMQKNRHARLCGGHVGRVSTLDWSGNVLASGSKDGYVTVWDIRSRAEVVSYKAHEQEISGLRWNTAGDCIASGGNDNKLVLYDIRSSR